MLVLRFGFTLKSGIDANTSRILLVFWAAVGTLVEVLWRALLELSCLVDKVGLAVATWARTEVVVIVARIGVCWEEDIETDLVLST